MAPRNRKKKSDQWMPPRVYRGKSAYEFHPKSGGAVRLCGLDASEAEVWTRYRLALGEIQAKTCQWLADKYFASHEFKQLSPRTRRDYANYWKRLRSVFGEQLADSVRPEHVRQYMDLRGDKSPAMANKEKKLFAILMRYGHERGVISANPCDTVKSFKERGRDRYVTDAEYTDLFQYADPALQVMMEISYTCAARGQDVRKIAMNDIQADGLYIEQAKTGKKQLKLWSKRLREAVNRAKELRRQRLKATSSMFLIVTPSGGPYSADGLNSLWRRARYRRMEVTATDIDWTFHDIKAKSISDYEGDKQGFSGHRDRSMMERYNRSVDRVRALDTPRKGK